ncbi:MAG TPA: NAD-dependent epimerase/dehydratase family protein [Steroidobacteraceae bacterium]|nr:NAD-dependent epimerase/dehydratase family protein [Steroidobacteraceae bacterium]
MSPPQVLVLGAEGFVGRRLTAKLHGMGWEPAAKFDTADAIVNAAYGRPAKIRTSANALFDRAASHPARPRIVHLSSMTVYGSASGIVDEGSELRADLGDYSAAQLEAERRAAAYPNCVVLRSSCEYGPSCPQWSERIARLLKSRRLGDLGAQGDGYCNLVYIDDLVAAIIAAIRRPGIEARVFNVAAPEPITWNDYFLRFARALGAVPLRRIGAHRLRWETKALAPPLQILELIAQRLHLPLSTPPVLSPSLARLCEQEIRLDSRLSTEQLGLSYISLDEGLARTAQAY